jgi:hypothetical protein
MSTATLAIYIMATLQTLEAESLLLFRSQGMILVFLEAAVANSSVGDI